MFFNSFENFKYETNEKMRPVTEDTNGLTDNGRLCGNLNKSQVSKIITLLSDNFGFDISNRYVGFCISMNCFKNCTSVVTLIA